MATPSDLDTFPSERFEELRALGEGGMARVILARDRELDRSVAIKWTHSNLLDHENIGQRFRNEARFLGAVHHPSVVQVYGCVEAEDGAVGLVMEYVEGQDLQQELDRRGRLPPEEVRAVGVQVAGALGALHAEKIFHRDLKPANLMRRAGDRRVVLMDLGLASSSEVTRMTRTGYLVGTLSYMAPEVLRGEEYTPAADVYQLGATLWELITGDPMIRSRTLDESFRLILDGQRPVVDPASREIPEALWEAILAAVAVDPAQRPRSAEAFAALLRRAEPGGAASGLQAGRGVGRWGAIALGVSLVAAVAWHGEVSPPREVRWRVVGGAAVVETALGGPEDLRIEVDGEVSPARFVEVEGRRRAVVPRLRTDREVALRLFWDGGQGPIQRLQGVPEALGSLEFGGRELLRVHARRRCEVGFGPVGSRLWALAPGRHPVPAPARLGTHFRLRWVDEGLARDRKVSWGDLFTEQARRLTSEFSDIDVHGALLAAQKDRTRASFSEERLRWTPALPWLPEVLEHPEVSVSTRRRLLRAFQVWQRSAAEERLLGGFPEPLVLPRSGPGGRLSIRVHEGDPEEPPPLAGRPVAFESGGCEPDEGTPGHYVLATEHSRHVGFGDYARTCAALSWRWPDLGASGRDPLRLWIRTPRMASRAVLRLTLAEASDEFQVDLWRPEEGIQRDNKAFRGWLGYTLPAALWPRPGQLVSLEVVDLLRPEATLAKVWKIRLDRPARE